MDDEKLMRRLVSTVLQGRGHEVVVFENGLDAVNAILASRFDVVVCDLKMPELRGDELCAQLREQLGLRAPPVVIVSGAEDEDDVGRALDAGALHFIKKPFTSGELLAIVERAAKRATAQAAADGTPTRLGSFEIQAEIGRGGMGRVYKASRGGKQMALKVLPARLTSVEDHLRFRRELDILSSLEHPGIPRVLETGTEDGWVFFAMELVPGRTVDSILADTGAFPWPLAVRLARDVAVALAYVHGRGLIHRDVKPSNVVVKPEGQPVLVDFGLARRPRDLALTSRDSILGTPAYLAPELLQGPPGQATDVFALGIMLHEMLIGHHPIAAVEEQNALALIKSYADGQIPAVGANVPDELALLVARMEAPAPSARPTAVEVAGELGRLLIA